MFQHPAASGTGVAAAAYLAVRLAFFTGPGLGIGNTGTTWGTTLVAGAIGAVVVGGLAAPSTGYRRLLALGFVSAAGGGITAVSLLLFAYLLDSTLFHALLAGDVGAAGWTLLVTAFVWATLLAIVVACSIVAAPVAVLVSRIRARS